MASSSPFARRVVRARSPRELRVIAAILDGSVVLLLTGFAAIFAPQHVWLALALLSALGPDRTARAIRERDIAALSSVTGIGRKKAERLILELQDRFDDLPDLAPRPAAPGAEQAVRALTGLGYAPAAAEDAVRTALANGGDPETSAVVRRALQVLAPR